MSATTATVDAAMPTAPPGEFTYRPSWTTPPSSEWPTSHRAFWLWVRNHPDPLYASLISSWTSNWHSAMTYLVECPSETCSTKFAKQTITHSDGSVWAGEHVLEGVTTTWACNMATNSWQSEHGYGAECTITSGKDVDLKLPLTQSTSLEDKDLCFVSARSVLVHITGNLDEFYKEGWYPPPQQADTNVIRSRLTEAADEVCPADWTAISTEAEITSDTSATVAETTRETTSEPGETEGSNDDPGDGGSRSKLAFSVVLGMTVLSILVTAF